MPRPSFSPKTSVAPSGARKASFRPDVQGLRAFAVIAVVIDHLFGWPGGGFVGVDVFFVISGFLITSLLLREHERTGRISFVGFYRRRVKRIIPAATVVLVVTTVASYFLFNTGRFVQTVGDSVAAFFFAANWHFAFAGTNYFQAAGPVSPLQHYWSLSVEEQFYFVWPWLMLLIFLIGAKTRKWSLRRARIAAAIAMGLIIVISFSWALWETATNPTWAYFSTFSRAWELGIGALVAVSATICAKIPGWVRTAMGWVGIVGIVFAVFTTSSTAGFPAPWAAVAVLSTAMAIAGGTGGDQHYVWPIMNPVSRWFGDISYSLYLWHFPVIILLATLLPTGSLLYSATCIAGMMVLSVASYYALEDPIRRSHWLERLSPAERQHLRQERLVAREASNRPVFSAIALVMLAVVTVGLVGAAMLPHARQHPVAFADPHASGGLSAKDAVPASVKTPIAKAIYQALQAKSWPSLNPTIDTVLSSPQTPSDISACGNPNPPSASACTFGPANPTKTAVIVGDSTSVAYEMAWKNIANATGSTLSVRADAMFGCPFVDIPIQNSDTSLVAACPARKASAITLIQRIHPDLVIITNTYEQRKNVNGSVVTDAQWSAGMKRLTDQFAADTGKVVFLSPPPSDKNVQTCFTKVSTPESCAGIVTSTWLDKAANEKTIAKSLNGVFIDSRQWFCVEGQCPEFVGSTPVKLDLVHITAAYATVIAPLVRQALVEAKLY